LVCFSLAAWRRSRGFTNPGIEELQRQFQSPPDDSRIMMRWWWFGPAVTKPKLNVKCGR